MPTNLFISALNSSKHQVVRKRPPRAEQQIAQLSALLPLLQIHAITSPHLYNTKSTEPTSPCTISGGAILVLPSSSISAPISSILFSENPSNKLARKSNSHLKQAVELGNHHSASSFILSSIVDQPVWPLLTLCHIPRGLNRC